MLILSQVSINSSPRGSVDVHLTDAQNTVELFPHWGVNVRLPEDLPI